MKITHIGAKFKFRGHSVIADFAVTDLDDEEEIMFLLQDMIDHIEEVSDDEI